MMHAEAMSPEMKKCVDACLAAHSMCEEMISHCLQMSGDFVDPVLMRTLMDCADITRTCADICMRMSPMSGEMSTLCAQMCDRCAEACMRMADDPQMKQCAEACSACAQACRAMAGAHA